MLILIMSVQARTKLLLLFSRNLKGNKFRIRKLVIPSGSKVFFIQTPHKNENGSLIVQQVFTVIDLRKEK